MATGQRLRSGIGWVMRVVVGVAGVVGLVAGVGFVRSTVDGRSSGPAVVTTARVATTRASATTGASAPASGARQVALVVGDPRRDGSRTLTALVTGFDVAVVRVEFRRDGVLLGSLDAAPWELTVPTLGSGDHVLNVLVRTADGRVTASPPVEIGTGGPAADDTFRAVVEGCCPAEPGAPLRLSAVGVTGNFTRVEYLLDGEVVATSNRPPTFVATMEAAAGIVTARGIDSAGRRWPARGAVAVVLDTPPALTTTIPPTAAPSTSTASTSTPSAPSTSAPSTSAPSTSAPSTSTPSTSTTSTAPATTAPTTVPTTTAPTTAPTTTKPPSPPSSPPP
ncbi:MAG: hypothetical protein ACKO91_19005 [Acidimicrobiales bacterium]